MVRFRTRKSNRKSKGGGKHGETKRVTFINALRKSPNGHRVITKRSKPKPPKTSSTIYRKVIKNISKRTLARSNTIRSPLVAAQHEKKRAENVQNILLQKLTEFSSPSVAAAAATASSTANNVAKNQQEFAAAMAAAAEESTPPLTPPLTQQNETGHGGGKRCTRNNRLTHKKRN